MKTLFLLILTLPFLSACHKKPDNPPQVAASTTATPPPPPPPPVSSCKGATVPWSSPTGEIIQSLNSRAFTIPDFDLGCGDSVRVFIRKDNTQAWFELANVNAGFSYYSLADQMVTVFNMTGIDQEVDIEAILK